MGTNVGALATTDASNAFAEVHEGAAACRNCAAPLTGPYCALCGQERNTHRRSVRGLVHELIEELASFDSRMLRTARALLFEPGELSRAFREGRTVPYVPPVRLYLFVSVVFFVILGMTNIAILQLEITAQPHKVMRDRYGHAFIDNPAFDAGDKDPDLPRTIEIPSDRVDNQGIAYSYGTVPHFFARMGAYHSKLSSVERVHLAERQLIIDKEPTRAQKKWIDKYIFGGMNKLAADPAALNAPLTTWLPRALFLLLPLYALLLALMHVRRRRDFYLVDHVVFSLNIHTFTFVALLAAVALGQVISGEIVAWLLLAVISLYIFLAMKRFYGQSWFWTTFKFVVVSGIYTVFFLLPALAGVFALSFFGGSFG